MNDRDNLEDRLREHYTARAGELRLPALEFDDVLAGADDALAATPSNPTGRRNPAWLVAAAIVGGAAIGAGAIVATRNEDSNTSDVAQTAPDSIAVPVDGCAVPDDVADLDVPNDVRANGVLLPSTTPSGYCASDHRVGTDPPGGVYTVWASCERCERPTSAIARVQYRTDEDFEGDLDFEQVDVGGQPGRFYAPSADVPVSRLYVGFGAVTVVGGADQSALFVGWGLDQIRFAHLAAVALNQQEGSGDLDTMKLVFEGALGQYLPASVPMASTVSVWYFDDDGIALGYRLLESQTSEDPYTPPLEAYVWALPDPAFSTVEGRRTVTFPPSSWYDDREQTAVISQIDDDTQVMWSSTGNPPVDPAEMSAIELTPADVNDPRWLEIAYESGMYDAVG